MAPSADPPTDVLRETGAQIEALLEASSVGGVVARERSEQLVRLVVDLYGAGLDRLLDVLFDAGCLDAQALDALAEDELVAGLLLVHGLHPHDVGTRVERALDGVRPYLGSHGGDVELLEVTGRGVVRLRLLGSCDGCPSSAATLQLAVEGAVQAAAPEVTSIEVEAAEAGGHADGSGRPAMIAVDSLRVRLADVGGVDGPAPSSARPGWIDAPEVAELSSGELRGLVVGGTRVLACRLGADLYAYRDRCPQCAGSLAGARLERVAGAAPQVAVLTCPSCRSHYDVRRAGAPVDRGAIAHLEPVPLLTRDDGVVSLALAAEVVTA